MTNVLLVGDTSNRANWGCRTTSKALRTLIAERARLAHVVDTMTWPACYAVETAERPDAPAGYGERFAFALSSPLSETEIAAQKAEFGKRGLCLAGTVDKHIALFRKHNYGGLNDVLAAVDAIVLNGEGGVMERRGAGRLAFFLLCYNAAVFRKPIAIVNHTCDLTDPDMKAIAALAYPHASAIRVRETRSLAQASAVAGGADLKLAADAAFKFRPVAPPSREGLLGGEHFDPEKPYICLGGSASWRSLALSEDDEAAFVDLVHAVRRIAPVVLLAAGTPEDVIFAKLAENHPIALAPPDYPTQRAVDLLGGAAAYVGGRWHSAIKALGGGTPVVLFDSNSLNKNAGLIEMLGVEGLRPPHAARGLAGSAGAMLAELRGHLDAGARLRNRILDRVGQLEPTIDLNVDILT